jgi:hypothetical protein
MSYIIHYLGLSLGPSPFAMLVLRINRHASYETTQPPVMPARRSGYPSFS